MNHLDQTSSFLSLLPPLIAILLSFIVRQAQLSILLGICLGCLFLAQFELIASLDLLFQSAISVFADVGHQKILLFSLLLGGLVGLIRVSGGAASFADWVCRFATNKRRAEGMIWLSGLLLFVDDYANALLVGSSMRPVADKHRIPREKLAFLVDATSAPVASIALISSWIGVELGHIAEQTSALGLGVEPYSIFLQTLPYRFYPLLMIGFCAFLIWKQVDFVRWEREGPSQFTHPKFNQGDFEEENVSSALRHNDSRGWLNAFVPLLVLIGSVFGFMVMDGFNHTSQRESFSVGSILSHADTSMSLLIGTLVSTGAAILIVKIRSKITPKQLFKGWAGGVGSVVKPCAVLILAWMLGGVCKDLGTAANLAVLLKESLPLQFLPALVFVIAALISFATGTSWGTMAVLFPVAIPLVSELGVGSSIDMSILVSSIASILSGSVWGDHCSPISDTTILSALSSGCDPISHVRTQLPNALLVGFVSILFGEIAVGFGLYSPWVGLFVGFLFLLLLVWSLSWFRKNERNALQALPHDG